MSSRRRRVRIDLAYDGTDYCGWQVQRSQRTVQGVLERALSKLHGGTPVGVRGAGRTDSGVHAHGQVADCEVSVQLDDAGLAYALRRLLPPDIRPLEVRTVSRSFHSRKDARSKLYRYRIDRTPHGDPFASRFALHHPAVLDEGLMQEGLRLLPGRHDWSGFTTPRSDKEDPVRVLTSATLERRGGEIVLAFEANGFLRYMVRNLVGTIVEIGKGRMPVERIREVLDSGDQDLAGPTALPKGLHLIRVDYPQ